MNENELIALANAIIPRFIEKNVTLAVAESCTGGWLSKILTEVSGVSAIYKGGVCSYSNEIKMNILGVKEETLSLYGAVSEQTAIEMAQGITKAMNCDVGIGITGIAGPTSDNTLKPVGLIYIALSYKGNTMVTCLQNTFTDNVRANNRFSAVKAALKLLGDINE